MPSSSLSSLDGLLGAAGSGANGVTLRGEDAPPQATPSDPASKGTVSHCRATPPGVGFTVVTALKPVLEAFGRRLSESRSEDNDRDLAVGLALVLDVACICGRGRDPARPGLGWADLGAIPFLPAEVLLARGRGAAVSGPARGGGAARERVSGARPSCRALAALPAGLLPGPALDTTPTAVLRPLRPSTDRPPPGLGVDKGIGWSARAP
mmetsp:Transcript_8636/g.18917  ORF Transcript_8636/g.18917 Transcript_8636/m.18917 type:complete len:209 (-) Transcript_8636:1361-1987(-)